MLPRSLSASSLQVAEGCLSRYHAEYIQYARGATGSAASVGLVCHETLENFLRGVFIRKDLPWSRKTLDDLFNKAYEKIIGADRAKPEYTDAYGLVVKWFNADGRKEYFENNKILSLEAKNNFQLPVMIPDEYGTPTKSFIQVNYIMDRLDQTGPKEYKVVDYKSNWVPLTHDQLRKKIQARLYALAVQIIHPEAERIWVEFDFLRHESIGIALSKEDQAETWRMLKRSAQLIIDTDEETAAKTETVNAECSWCIRKATCGALSKVIAVGGIQSLSVEEKAERFLQIRNSKKALEILEGELQDSLLMELIAAETIDLDLDTARVRLKRSSRRSVDSRMVAKILGPDISSDLGNFTLGSLDQLRRDPRVTSDQLIEVQKAISMKMGDPTVEVTLK